MTMQDSNDDLERQLSELKPLPMRPDFKERLLRVSRPNGSVDSLSVSTSPAPAWGLSQVLISTVLLLLFGVFVTLAQQSGDDGSDSASRDRKPDVASRESLEHQPVDLLEIATNEPTLMNMRMAVSNRVNLAELLDRQSSQLLTSHSDSVITHAMK